MKEAAALAAAAQSVAELKAAAQNFNGLALKRTATQIVFADGNPQARIMLIGDAPGADEDRTGVPFAGASGQLLDKMLGAIGLGRAGNVYIATILNWRTPGNRTPSKEEIDISLPFIRRHIELIKPAVIVLVGGAAAKILLEKKEPVSHLRGKWFDYRDIPAAVLFHPEYLLQSPQQKKPAWEDLQMIQAKLKELG
ncbi:MAG: uracil-DNA glycosylase, partial [Alphaproteobacteria bacterium]|nr:uracil-DNA glycosylase [Alphaproteobacteria bacterium]